MICGGKKSNLNRLIPLSPKSLLIPPSNVDYNFPITLVNANSTRSLVILTQPPAYDRSDKMDPEPRVAGKCSKGRWFRIPDSTEDATWQKKSVMLLIP